MPRPIDHLVLPVRDLEDVRGFYGRLGFTLTPRARHPWGTENSLVQFDGSFLELLTVADLPAIPEPGPGRFSFGAFNRDFLARREGFSMLVLASRDAAADRAAFARDGLPVFEPFRFERQAQRPDGEKRTVAFSLAFTADPRLPEAGFFTCEQHYPENFWNPAVQDHPNGATGIAGVVMVADRPAEFADFLGLFAGVSEVKASEAGILLDTGRGTVAALTPEAFRSTYGEDALPADLDTPRLGAVRVAVRDRAEIRARLQAEGVPFADRPSGTVVPPHAAFGTTLVLEQADGR